MPKRSRVPVDSFPRPIREGEVRVGPLAAIPALLRQHGVDPVEVFADVGLDPVLFEDVDNPVPFETSGRLLAVAAERCGCPHFGLLIGAMSASASLGVVGHLVRHSPDVGAALRNVIVHLHLHDAGAVPTLAIERGVAILGYAVYERGVEGTYQIYDIAMAIAYNMMREFCGPDWRPKEVLLAHRRPRAVAPYRSFFDAPLRFDSDQTALVFKERWLGVELQGANAHLQVALEAYVGALEERAAQELPHRLRRALRSLLVTGQGSRDEVAKLFSMNRRTLNRRLEACGTSFHALVDEVSHEIACQLLRDTQMPLAQIAATLDYADASAFTRAFRRWAGAAPSDWRAAHTPLASVSATAKL